jgi:hypothetical protein
MLTITVEAIEAFDDDSQEFISQGGTILEFEHSLVSLSKWESIYEKPFLSKESKSAEEIVEYIKCMLLTPKVPEEIFRQLSLENYEKIHDYINGKRSATWFNETPEAPGSRETVTSELIYYWMTVFNIPFECDQWHLNRLFTLIRICNLKQAPQKKMNSFEMAQYRRQLNAQRRAELGTSG